MNEIIERIGGFGRFQKLVLFIAGLMSSCVSMCTYLSVFNNARPALNCYFKSNGTPTDPAEICVVHSNYTQNEQTSPYECSYSTLYYGVTIVTEWHLICDKILLASYTQTIFMVGSLLSFICG